MAVLKTFTTQLGDKTYRSRIKAYACGTFSLRIPTPVAEITGVKKVSYNTMSGVKLAFDDAIKRYTASITSTRKVIVHRTAVQAQIFRKDKKVVNSIALPYSRGSGSTFAVCVYMERVVQYSKEYSVTYYDNVADQKIPEGFRNTCGIHQFNRSDYTIRAWTRHMEAAAVRKCKAEEDRILALLALDKASDEDFIKAIDASIKPRGRPRVRS